MNFSHYLESIENVAIFPLISLIIFIVIFIVVILYVTFADKKKMQDNADIIMD